MPTKTKKKVTVPPKPKKKAVGGKSLNYHVAIDYIENKYKIDTQNYKGMKFNGKPDDAEYCNFWHWFIDGGDIHNGCFAHLDFESLEDKDTPAWVKEILLLIKKEFSPRGNVITFWVEW